MCVGGIWWHAVCLASSVELAATMAGNVVPTAKEREMAPEVGRTFGYE